MSDKDIAKRYRSFFGGDFMPLIRMDQTQGAPDRNAYANEYAAFHLGQINDKLGRPVALMEQSAMAGSRT